MNLNISYNWLKSYVKTNLSAPDFAKKISLAGPSVDHINEIKPDFEKVVVGQIIKINQHPDADKLQVCEVDIGKEKLQIICGAPNIQEGQKVPVVLVGGRAGDLTIKEAKIRGVESFGMMASQKELGLGEDHSGIYILPDYTQVGLPLEKVMPAEDTIFDMEVTSNRPDAMCVIGVAREAAAILKEKFLYHQPKPNLGVRGEEKKLSVSVKEPKLCPRYQAIVMSDVLVGPSPLWMQQRLLSAGLRPINNLVDITNYILLEFGQPMHVFDYDKLKGRQITVRLARKGEKILALDGQEYELKEDNLAITDTDGPIAVAGVMGGELSAATINTQNIVFECANFDPVSIRSTARALNLHSESSDLYEKGISPINVEAALLRAIELAQELAGARVTSKIIDINNYKYKTKELKLKPESVKKVLGVEIKAAEIKETLENLGFKVAASKGELKITVPFWRDRDMEGEHDLVEEVARIHGYYNLPTKLMNGDIPKNFSANREFYWQDKVKDILVGFGLAEIYTYSFISEKQITNYDLNPATHLRIANPLSADFEYLRTSLLPGALSIISENSGFFPEVKLFDLSNVYLPIKDKDLPLELPKLLIIVSNKNTATALSDVKGIFEGLLKKLNITAVTFKRNSNEVKVSINGDEVGLMGMVNKKIVSNFGVKSSVAFAEVDFKALAGQAKSAPAYQPIPKFPAIELDLSMEIDNVVTFAEISNIVSDAGAPLVEKIEFLSVYQGEGVAYGHKALAIRMIYRDLNKTLELAEAQKTHDKIVAALKKEYNIKVR